ncbi:Thioredoxin-like fold [Phytophthora cactorum]|nr:Thioredoxin-like fold [Phytophthora cactorum]
MLHLFNKLLFPRGAEPSQEVQESGKSGFTQASRASPGHYSQPSRATYPCNAASKLMMSCTNIPWRFISYLFECMRHTSVDACVEGSDPAEGSWRKAEEETLGQLQTKTAHHHSAISSSGISDTLVTNTMSPVKTCVVLTSSMVSITEQKYEIGHLKQLLDGNKIKYTEVDCSLEENRDTRNRYFEASGIRANYPQVFLQDPEGTDIQYIGSFKEIQELNEVNDVSPEILKANNIPTLNSVFAGTSFSAVSCCLSLILLMAVLSCCFSM